jgi:hypothetical protein
MSWYNPNWTKRFSVTVDKTKVGEHRLSDIARSDGWFVIEKNNFSSSSTFYSIGSQESESQDNTCYYCNYSSSKNLIF